MIEVMGSLRITEAELARDVHAVLAKVRTGVEVIVEQDHRPVATIRRPRARGGPAARLHRFRQGQRLESDIGRRHGQPPGTTEGGSLGQRQNELGTCRRVVSGGAGSMAETRTRGTGRSKSYPRRGEIYLTTLNRALGHEISKTRPAPIIQNDISNQYSQAELWRPSLPRSTRRPIRTKPSSCPRLFQACKMFQRFGWTNCAQSTPAPAQGRCRHHACR